MEPPKGTSNHRFVWSYHNELRLYFTVDDKVQYTRDMMNEIIKYKEYLLEKALGYKVVPLESIIPHSEWDAKHA